MTSLTRRISCHENVTVDTAGRREHTFCGVMFPVGIKRNIPIEKVSIQSLSVRGHLGPITVWVAGIKSPFNVSEQVLHYSKTWHLIYQRFHPPSMHRYVALEIPPLILHPGESCIFYIHSSHRSDQAIVYENAHSHITYQDDVININAGRAHISTRPFGALSFWGYPGAWRDDRAFVGQLQYGITYKSWNPHIHVNFGQAYDQMVLTLLMCRRRTESPISLLSDDSLFLLLQMCGYNWASACYPSKKRRRKRSRRRMIQWNPITTGHHSCLKRVFHPRLWLRNNL